MDEHEEVSDKRVSHRRNGDVESVGEVRLLRHELDALRKELNEDETDYEGRLNRLEKSLAEFERKFAGIKGVFYGAAFVIVSISYLVVDRIRELFIK